ncbi:hypothetical protein HanXRQr2_Chr05g0237881 [Helianthus annuus]|uniref:Uncharacterized protein n=1 Tax=Helianthus annuus TaxID=4232 RepID=A0A9K3NQK0_HELAN|nr:hypothetical protein HanXRQr2_Chr05g0237881 [Helianthus annuus]
MKVYPKSSIIWTSISISRHPKSWNNCLQPNQRQISVAKFLSTFEHSTPYGRKKKTSKQSNNGNHVVKLSQKGVTAELYILDAAVTLGDVGGKLGG